ncbi:MAG: hypothetical protein IAI48_17150 [Candidatus Eremiobacteraeota bacterium]|nr:hypothetical protein [Candidatus Eremiobacteraeota bacterium]
MSLATRDVAALEAVRSRTFADAYVASFELELQARRLTVCFYGTLRAREGATYLGTVTFFGAGELGIENADGIFPDSAQLASVSFSDFEEESERGFVEVRGARAWVLSWSFDGLSYEEHEATLASLADET